MTLIPAPKGPGGFIRRDDPGEPLIGKPRVSITRLEAEILTALAMDVYVLEIGTGLGVSTRALARHAAGVVTYDIDPWVQEVIWGELRHELNGFVEYTLNPITHAGDIDLVFIDADHDTEAVRADIRLAEDVLCGYGMIVAHDALAENVERALDDSWTIIPTEHGLGLKVVDA